MYSFHVHVQHSLLRGRLHFAAIYCPLLGRTDLCVRVASVCSNILIHVVGWIRHQAVLFGEFQLHVWLCVFWSMWFMLIVIHGGLSIYAGLSFFYRRNTQNLNLQGLKTCDDVQNHVQIGSCNKQWGLQEWSFPIFLQRASLWIVPVHSNAQICSNLDHHYDGHSRRLGTTRIPKTHGISSHSLTGSTYHIRRSKGDNFGCWKLFWLQSLQLKCVQWPWSGWTSLWLRRQGHCFGRAPLLRIPWWWKRRCLCHPRCLRSMT